LVCCPLLRTNSLTTLIGAEIGCQNLGLLIAS
jgi:hypothetical protein